MIDKVMIMPIEMSESWCCIRTFEIFSVVIDVSDLLQRIECWRYSILVDK